MFACGQSPLCAEVDRLVQAPRLEEGMLAGAGGAVDGGADMARDIDCCEPDTASSNNDLTAWIAGARSGLSRIASETAE